MASNSSFQTKDQQAPPPLSDFHHFQKYHETISLHPSKLKKNNQEITLNNSPAAKVGFQVCGL